MVLWAVMAAAALAVVPVPAQRLPGQLTGLLGIADLLRGRPLTGDLSDAVTEAPFLDGLELLAWRPLGREPRAPLGAFRPRDGGAYFFANETYCLGPGRYGPGAGDGYLYAPLKGPRARLVRQILQRASQHPKLPQDDIQVLLWGVLARARLSEMDPDARAAADVLLSDAERREVNGGALGLVPRDAIDRALESAPPALQRAFGAEAGLRDLLADGDAAYADYERVAVLEGDPPPGGQIREVPVGRWSYHPSGYFLRYRPWDYRQNLVEIYLPERFLTEFDERGRVQAVGAPDGERIDVTYADGAVGPAGGVSGLRAEAFGAVRWSFNVPDSRARVVRGPEWKTGWTLTGDLPAGDRAPDGLPRFPGLDNRVTETRRDQDAFDRLVAGARQVAAARVEIGPATRQHLTALAHLARALAALDRQPAGAPGPAALAWRAWASTFASAAGSPAAAAVTPGWLPVGWLVAQPPGDSPFIPVSLHRASPSGGLEIDLSDGSGQPGSEENQVQGHSARPEPRDDRCAGAYSACWALARGEFLQAAAACVGIGENDRADVRDCLWKAEDDFRRNQQNCRTEAQYCLTH
jgi:hypothetical protein